LRKNLFHNLTFTFGCTEAKEVLYGGKVKGLTFFARTRSPYGSFVRDRKSLLECILVMNAKTICPTAEVQRTTVDVIRCV
jgi:hypothetical protein